MADQFTGKVAVVTGAGSGIGRASARLFAAHGAKVVVNDIREEGAHETVRMIQEAGGTAVAVVADISQAAQVEALIETTVETYGRIDLAHNNAGIGNFVPITLDTEADFDRLVSINLKGVWLCMKYEITQFLKQGGGGAIVNTASSAGLIAVPYLSSYVASKFGVVGLTKSIALEYGDAGIRVNAVCPGSTDTPLARSVDLTDEQVQQLLKDQAFKRFAQPEEIAQAAVWLCSDEASFVTGVAFPVDGGRTAQ